MKNLPAGLAALFLLGALVAFLGCLFMVHAGPGVSFAVVVEEVYRTGNLLVSGAAVLVAAAAVAAGLWVRTKAAVRILAGVLWLAGLAAVLMAVWQSAVMLARIQSVSANMGGILFSIRAPGYADLLLILAMGLLAGGVAFGGVAWLQRQRRAGLRSV